MKKKQFKIVLLGSIPKGDDVRKNWVDWKTSYIEKISKSFDDIEFLHGDLISDNVGPNLVVGHDLWLIKHADLAIVNAQEKIGAGTAQEMVIAKAFKKPLIAIIPKNTHHRKSNISFHGVNIEDWIHPFLSVSSDFVAESIDEAISWIEKYRKSIKTIKVKNLSVFDDSIKKFEYSLEDIYQEYIKRGWK